MRGLAIDPSTVIIKEKTPTTGVLIVYAPKSAFRLTSDGTPVFEEWQDRVSPLRNAINNAQRDYRHAQIKLNEKVIDSITFEVQGRFVKVSTHGMRGGKRGTAKRGVVSEFSRKSRKRLLELFARLDFDNHKAFFITLTYHDNVPDEKTAKMNLRRFLKRLWRVYGDFAVVWRMEYQERGAVHFHLFCFDMPYIGKKDVLNHWRVSTGDDTITMTRVEAIHGARKATSYVSKYISKCSNQVMGHSDHDLPEMSSEDHYAENLGLGGFNGVPYLATPRSTGRFWGVEQKVRLPFASIFKSVCHGKPQMLHDIKRMIRKFYPRTNKGKYVGASLFTNNGGRWVDFFWMCAANQEFDTPKLKC